MNVKKELEKRLRQQQDTAAAYHAGANFHWAEYETLCKATDTIDYPRINELLEFVTGWRVKALVHEENAKLINETLSLLDSFENWGMIFDV